MTTTIHSGTIEVVTTKYRATSKLEHDSTFDFWSYSAAAFYLWLIETRIQGRNYRTGRSN